jgi:antitoxin HicB
MRYAYPYETMPEREGGFSVAFPDVPGARTQGETLEECAEMAEDALVTALSAFVEAGLPAPPPSAARGRPVAILPPLVAAKLALHARRLELGLTEAEFARRVGMDQRSAQRLLDPLHRSHIETVDAGLRALGRRLIVGARAA